MPDLPTDTNDSPNYTSDEHATHHNTLHGLNNELSNFVQSASAPGSPAAGDLWLDTATTAIVNVFVGARAYNSGTIACTNSTDTVITLDSERYDTDAIHSTSSNTGRLTAPTTGKYHISGTAAFAANATGARGLGIRLNGTTFIALVREAAVPGGSDVTSLTIDTDYALTAADYVELIAYQTSGGSLNVISGGNYTPEFAMHMIGGAAQSGQTSVRGALGYAQATSTQASITTEADLTGLTVTVTTNASERIRIKGVILVQTSVAGDIVYLRIKESTTVLQIASLILSSTADVYVMPVEVILTPSAASHTYKLSLARQGGTGNISMVAGATFPSFILVEGIGT